MNSTVVKEAKKNIEIVEDYSVEIGKVQFYKNDTLVLEGYIAEKLKEGQVLDYDTIVVHPATMKKVKEAQSF